MRDGGGGESPAGGLAALRLVFAPLSPLRGSCPGTQARLSLWAWPQVSSM